MKQFTKLQCFGAGLLLYTYLLKKKIYRGNDYPGLKQNMNNSVNKMWQPQPDIFYRGSKRTWLYTSLFRVSKMLLYQRAQRPHTFTLGKQN